MVERGSGVCGVSCGNVSVGAGVGVGGAGAGGAREQRQTVVVVVVVVVRAAAAWAEAAAQAAAKRGVATRTAAAIAVRGRTRRGLASWPSDDWWLRTTTTSRVALCTGSCEGAHGRLYFSAQLFPSYLFVAMMWLFVFVRIRALPHPCCCSFFFFSLHFFSVVALAAIVFLTIALLRSLLTALWFLCCSP